MSKPAFTPGPWTIGKGADLTPIVMVPCHPSEGTGFAVACVNPLRRMGSVVGDMNANARLIAAAPDMYEALKTAEFKLSIHEEGDDEPSGALATIRAALAKAHGG